MARKLAIQAARIAEDAHCENIVVLDLRGLSPVADYFVIATGTSPRQMRSVAEQIADYAEEAGERPYGRVNYSDTGWILLDFVSLVAHLFDSDHRDYYDLEMLWGDAPSVAWQRRSRASQTSDQR
jgi:ribosome-associated protein